MGICLDGLDDHEYSVIFSYNHDHILTPMLINWINDNSKNDVKIDIVDDQDKVIVRFKNKDDAIFFKVEFTGKIILDRIK